jgi:hypothetical protein
VHKVLPKQTSKLSKIGNEFLSTHAALRRGLQTQQVREVHDGDARRSGYAHECINIKIRIIQLYIYTYYITFVMSLIGMMHDHRDIPPPYTSSQPYARFTPGVNSDKFILCFTYEMLC